LFIMLPPPPRSTLFPYTTLFRSEYLDRYHYQHYRVPFGAHVRYLVRSEHSPERVLACLLWTSPAWKLAERDRWIGWSAEQRARRSEEHTSELQSRRDLVCRLLLE